LRATTALPFVPTMVIEIIPHRRGKHSARITRLLETAIPRRPRSAICRVLGPSILPIRGFLYEQTGYESAYLANHIRFMRAQGVVVGVSNPNDLRRR